MIPFKIPSAAEPLLQGDIVRWHDECAQPYGEAFSLIMNADCDLFTGKVQQFVTVVPIIRLDAYVNVLWSGEELKKLSNRICSDLSQYICRIAQRNNREFNAPSNEIIDEILNSSDPEQYFGELRFKNLKEREGLILALNCAKRAKEVSTGEPLNRPFEELCGLEAQFKKLAKEGVRKKLVQKIQNKITDPGQIDVFWISELPECSDIGFVVPLRHPRMIPLDRIVFERKQWFSSDDKALRMGRFIESIKYSIAEKFSNQFHRIGLPSVYESLRQSIVTEMCESLIYGSSTNV